MYNLFKIESKKKKIKYIFYINRGVEKKDKCINIINTYKMYYIHVQW